QIGINNAVNVNSIYFPGNVLAEGLCIDQFIKKINSIKNGGLSISAEALIAAGFDEIPIDGITIVNTSELDTTLFDYAGLKVDDEFVRENASYGSLQNVSLFSTTSIFTDTESISSGLFYSAESAFNLPGTDITSWYHYLETSEGNKLFYRSRNSISLIESISYIDSLFEEFLHQLNIYNIEEILPLNGVAMQRVLGDECISFRTWTAYNCILEYSQSLSYLAVGSEFNYGVTC